MISRRDFLKRTAGTALFVGGACGTIAPSAKAYTLRSKPKLVSQIATICEMCKANCPMVASLYKDGTIRLAGNRNNPIHGPALCSRGLAATRLLNHPDRLKFPMRRVGGRGQGRWQRISWDDAVQEIGRNIRKTFATRGGDGLALFAGGRSARHIKSFFTNLGCSNISDSSADRSRFIRALGYGTTFGTVPDPALVNLEGSRCVVLLGTPIGENVLVPQVRQFSKALARDDTQLVVVDPRFSAAAAKAQHHLPIKPGTDTALILCWINYIIENELFDRNFVEQSCLGFAELMDHVAPYTLERTATITDLPKAHIAGVAEIMGQAGAATTIVPGNHLSWYGNDVSRVRAGAILSALLGALPQSGEELFDFTATSKPVDVARVLGRIRSADIGVVGIWGQNLVQSESPSYFVTKALRDAKFVFCTDIFPSETSLYADIILPEASFLERDDFCKTWTAQDRKVIAGSFKVRDPLFGARPPFDIVAKIASASDLGDRFSSGSVKSLHELDAKGLDTNLPGLRRAGGVVVQRVSLAEAELVPGINDEVLDDARLEEKDPFLPPVQTFKTPSGKVELASSWLGHNGYETLPEYAEPLPVPEGFIRLVSGRCPVHTLTRTSGNSWLNHEIAENVLWLSEVGAATYGVKHGQRVRLESSDGLKSIGLIEVLVTPGIRDDCCYASHGFGNLSPLMSEGYNQGFSVSRLLSRSRKDPVSGVCGLRDIFVRPVRG